ncbi:hypothetical protein SSAG_00879 [Streptomyces sp. Mg1]|nr:hypothetical protein SSAG_00879 [Streptomyces sp. Mg1]
MTPDDLHKIADTPEFGAAAVRQMQEQHIAGGALDEVPMAEPLSLPMIRSPSQ